MYDFIVFYRVLSLLLGRVTAKAAYSRQTFPRTILLVCLWVCLSSGLVREMGRGIDVGLLDGGSRRARGGKVWGFSPILRRLCC